MINHDFQCSDGHTFEKRVSWETERVKCHCGKSAKRVFLASSKRPAKAQGFEPVVVFRKPDGTYKFPGRSNERTPKGTERIELRNLSEVRRFEREENRRLKFLHQESMGRREASYQENKRQMRSELRAMLPSMSGRARKLAAFLMARSDARESLSEKARTFDAEFRVDCFSNDRSNRPAWTDSDTGWRARRE